MHTKWQQKKLREVCAEANVHITAFSPLGSPLRHNGTIAVLEDPIIMDIASKHGKTTAQVSTSYYMMCMCYFAGVSGAL
jgi:diketogulonate reductase-like aldo/keto reductase